MPYKIVLQPGVEADIDSAYNWYENQQTGLGDLLLAELVSFYKKLALNPNIFSTVTKSYRQAILNRFPFVIIYEVMDMEVHIYSLFHTSRSPAKKFLKR